MNFLRLFSTQGVHMLHIWKKIMRWQGPFKHQLLCDLRSHNYQQPTVLLAHSSNALSQNIGLSFQYLFLGSCKNYCSKTWVFIQLVSEIMCCVYINLFRFLVGRRMEVVERCVQLDLAGWASPPSPWVTRTGSTGSDWMKWMTYWRCWTFFQLAWPHPNVSTYVLDIQG